MGDLDGQVGSPVVNRLDLNLIGLRMWNGRDQSSDRDDTHDIHSSYLFYGGETGVGEDALPPWTKVL